MTRKLGTDYKREIEKMLAKNKKKMGSNLLKVQIIYKTYLKWYKL